MVTRHHKNLKLMLDVRASLLADNEQSETSAGHEGQFVGRQRKNLVYLWSGETSTFFINHERVISLEDKKAALVVMREAQKVYDTWLGNEIVYLYKDKNQRIQELFFSPMKANYLHLCGVICKKGSRNLSAGEFYKLLFRNRLHPSMISFKDDGTTQLKLKALKHLHMLCTCNVRVIDNRITLLKVDCDAAIRSSKVVFVLGLLHDKGHYKPKSLLDGRTLKSIPTGCEVQCVYSKSLNTGAVQLLDCKDEFTTTKKYRELFT